MARDTGGKAPSAKVRGRQTDADERQRLQQENTDLRLQLKDQDLQWQSQQERYALLRRVIDGLRIILWIMAPVVPLVVIERIARDIAGKQTSFTFTLSITVALSVMLSIGWVQSELRSRHRKKKVETQRDTIIKLEARLEELRAREEG